MSARIIRMATGIALCAAGSVGAAETQSLSVTLRAGTWSMVREDGRCRVEMAGFTSAGGPGLPVLPSRVFRFLLPPGTSFAGAKITGQKTRTVALKEPWELGAPAHVGGEERVGTFDRTKPYPSSPVRLLGEGRRGPYRYVTLRFTPVRYAETARTAVITDELAYEIVCAKDNGACGAPWTWMPRDEAAEYFDNYSLTAPAYRVDLAAAIGVDPPMIGEGSADYIIVTTNDIYGEAADEIDAFAEHKRSEGYGVFVATENQYGAYPGDRTEQVRTYLSLREFPPTGAEPPEGMRMFPGIEYVLILAPHEDIPMKTVSPEEPDPTAGGIVSSKTDWYFADLDGDWDLDGDGVVGEWDDDRGIGGMGCEAEVKVGRIHGDTATIRQVLDRLIRYEEKTRNDPADIEWRYEFLQMAALLSLHRDGSVYGDGAKLMEHLWDQTIGRYAPFGSTRLYEGGDDGCTPCSLYYNEDFGALAHDRAVEEMAEHAHGIVWWNSHGTNAHAVRTIREVNGDACVDAQPPFIEKGDAEIIRNRAASAREDETQMPLIIAVSCANGDPSADKIAHLFLRDYAIGFVGYTADAYCGWLSGYEQGMLESWQIAFADRLLADLLPVGDAFAGAQAEYGPLIDSSNGVKNLQRIALYGDPSMRIYPEPDPVVIDPDRALVLDLRAAVADPPTAVGLWARQCLDKLPPATCIRFKEALKRAQSIIPVAVADTDGDGTREWTLLLDPAKSGAAMVFGGPEDGFGFERTTRLSRGVVGNLARRMQ